MDEMPALAQWIEWYGPAALATIAMLAAFTGWRSHRAHVRSEARARWWERATWAIARAQDEESEDAAVLGLQILTVMITSEVADKQERELAQLVYEFFIGETDEPPPHDAEPDVEYVVVPAEGDEGDGDE